jgi:hypothetical protein
MTAFSNEFSSEKQLRSLLERVPETHCALDLEGLVIDYLGQSGASLVDLFDLNPKIYYTLFTEGNGIAGKRLLKCIGSSTTDRELLISACEENANYPLVAQMLRTLFDNMEYGVVNVVDSPEKSIPTAIRAIVWHLSDIHFGKFNNVENDPAELASLLGRIVADYPRVAPSLVVVSGDVTSIGATKEFESFVEFCKYLSDFIWKGSFPERILVVPGNHDISWTASGEADRMAAFASTVGDANCCITPFGKETDSYAGETVSVKRYFRDLHEAPPIAEVVYKELDLRFILLVSGYFSGMVPSEVRDAITGSSGDIESLLNILRVDKGAVNRQYLMNITSNIAGRSEDTIAVIHHNPIQYGVETCENRFAIQLLETLHGKRVPLIFHGHTHLVDDPGQHRPAIPNQCYPVPCPTLCSVTSAGSNRGMNVHLVGGNSAQTIIGTILWAMSGTEAFKSEGARLRYKFSVTDGHVRSVEHGRETQRGLSHNGISGNSRDSILEFLLAPPLAFSEFLRVAYTPSRL